MSILDRYADVSTILDDHGTITTGGLQARYIHNDVTHETGLTLESCDYFTDIITGTDLTLSTTGNMIVGVTGYYDTTIEQYYDITAGTTICLTSVDEICLSTGIIKLDAPLISAIGKLNIDSNSDVDISAGTTLCLTAIDEICFSASVINFDSPICANDDFGIDLRKNNHANVFNLSGCGVPVEGDWRLKSETKGSREVLLYQNYSGSVWETKFRIG